MTRTFGLLLCLACGSAAGNAALAQDDMSAHMDPEIGRLFTTQEQRQDLQSLRMPKGETSSPPQADPLFPLSAEEPLLMPPLPLPPSPLPVLNGVVYRSDGKHAFWLDGTRHDLDQPGSLPQGWKVHEVLPDGLRLSVSPDEGLIHHLRPQGGPRPLPRLPRLLETAP